MKKLIIIPAYNEEANIEKTVTAIQRDAEDFDYVIINDCSTDRTREICEEQGYNIVNDGQHDPEFLNIMAEYIEKNQVDMVIGSRFIEKKGFQSSATRRVGIKFFSWLIKGLTGATITDPTSGLRMAGRNVIALFSRDYPKDYPEPESVVAVLRKGMTVREIPVVMHEREGGVSSISPKKSVYYMIKVTLAILIERIRKY